MLVKAVEEMVSRIWDREKGKEVKERRRKRGQRIAWLGLRRRFRGWRKGQRQDYKSWKKRSEVDLSKDRVLGRRGVGRREG